MAMTTRVYLVVRLRHKVVEGVDHRGLLNAGLVVAHFGQVGRVGDLRG
jgi:hypothetical protein